MFIVGPGKPGGYRRFDHMSRLMSVDVRTAFGVCRHVIAGVFVLMPVVGL